jgi:methionyl-tRNA formyltransferase
VPDIRFAFAGDRDISVRVLEFLQQQSARPAALLVPAVNRASHAEQLIERCAQLEPRYVLRGPEFRSPAGTGLLARLELDYIFCIHFPYLVPPSVLELPRHGVLNLHPAYLPYNRGWHTPSWAILEGTPYGATLHFMDEGVDSGDIVHQRELVVGRGDTANTLYARVKDLELEVFREAWPMVRDRTYRRMPQDPALATLHRRADLLTPAVQGLALDAETTVADLLRRLRALSTNHLEEAAYYVAGDKRYRVQVKITEEDLPEAPARND